MTTIVTDDRARFEAWAQSKGYDTAKEYGLYRRDNTTAAFDGYQAALADRGKVEQDLP